MNELSVLIKRMRKEKKMRQKEFADLSGLGTNQKVSNIEKGIIVVGLNLFKKVCENVGYEYEITIKQKKK
jgi:transcriptional regulator with XRE-family HTH domain